MWRWAFLLVITFLAACGVPSEQKVADVDGLARALQTMDSTNRVAPQEARRAAEIAYAYSLEQREAYKVSDPPLIHNTKVNQGLRPRGLCWHWADDLEARLRREGFKSFSFHRAIANIDNLRVEHSTVILSAKGAPMQDGIVLDGWRYGGYLFWAPLPEDTRYTWVPRAEVFATRRKGAL
ncbi:hypothetical protein [Shimia sp. SDUM112013]|uniref:hypothetical protein n=1 Tax=Shimia sp. SDUM112013 TaxID=3136160 RepID=UPI0032ED48D7